MPGGTPARRPAGAGTGSVARSAAILDMIDEPHPVLERFMYERARVHGAAVQTLDVPAGATTPTQ